LKSGGERGREAEGKSKEGRRRERKKKGREGGRKEGTAKNVFKKLKFCYLFLPSIVISPHLIFKPGWFFKRFSLQQKTHHLGIISAILLTTCPLLYDRSPRPLP
jgi:hypothetical protein